jgi:hypothetical protein
MRAALCRCTLSGNSTTPAISVPHLLFWIALRRFFSVSQYASDVTVVPCCMNSIISTPFLSQKTVAISLLAGWQRVQFFEFFGECVCIHCFGCSLVSAFTNEIRVSSPVWCDWEIHRHLYGITLKCQIWIHSLCFVHTLDDFQNPSCAELLTIA